MSREWRWIASAIAMVVLVSFLLPLVSGPLMVGAILAGTLLLVGLQRPRWFLDFLLLTGWFPLAQTTLKQKELLLAYGGINVSGLRLLSVVAALGVAVIATKRALLTAWRFKEVLVFLSFMGVTILYSESRLDGCRSLLKFLYPFLAFLLVLAYTNSRADLEHFWQTMIRGGWFASLFGVVMALRRDLFPTDTQFPAEVAVARFFGWAGYGSFALLAGVLALLAYARYQEESRNPVWLLTFLAFAVQMLLTGLRITFGALIMALIWCEWLRGKKVNALIVPLLALLVFVLAPNLRERMFYNRNAALVMEGRGEGLTSMASGLLSQINLRGRNVFWLIALQHISSHNFLQGAGLGTYAALSRAYFGYEMQAHNEYVKLLLESGVIGLVLLFGVYGRFLYQSVAIYRTATEPITRTLGLGASTAIWFFLITSITSNTLGYYAEFMIYIWVVMALALRASELEGSGTMTETRWVRPANDDLPAG